MGIEKDSFFVLYAPTFRVGESVTSYITDFHNLQKTFENNYGKTTIAVRLHPNLRESRKAVEWLLRSKMIDASAYPDSDELAIAADCLITDYSSIAYDFALIKKRVFLYVKDMEQYIGNRGVYDIFYEQPFRLNTDMNMLLEEIAESTQENYYILLKDFYRRYPTYNTGTASAQSVDWLIKKGLKQEKADNKRRYTR